jgi:hypothetical protein
MKTVSSFHVENDGRMVAGPIRFPPVMPDGRDYLVHGSGGKSLIQAEAVSLPMPEPGALEEMTREDEQLAREYTERKWPGQEILDIPTIRKLPVYAVYLDPEKRLWLSKTPWAEIRMGKSRAVSDLYGLSGEPLISVRLPEGVTPGGPFFVVEGNRALGFTQDEYDQQSIVIMEIPSG